MPATIVQLTDLHITAGDPQPEAALARAVAHVGRLVPEPLAVLVTGDLTHGGRPDEYAVAARLLRQLRAPVHVIPGNHDDRTALRAAFALPGAPEDPISGVVSLGALRVVLADTTVPGTPGGQLDLETITAQLLADLATPTILALHHPPLRIGVAAIDAMGLPDAQVAALGTLLRTTPNVVRVIAGHVHRCATGALGGVPVFTAPSVAVQLVLDLTGDTLGMNPAEPCGFAIHVLTDGGLVSHVQPVLGL